MESQTTTAPGTKDESVSGIPPNDEDSRDSGMPSSSSETMNAAELLEKPTRPLSAYNLFFRDEREKLIAGLPTPPSARAKKKNGRGIGFSNMAKTISARWKEIPGSTKERYESIAAAGRVVYNKKIEEWRQQRTALGLPTKRKNKKRTDKKTSPKQPPAKDRKKEQIPSAQPTFSNGLLHGVSVPSSKTTISLETLQASSFSTQAYPTPVPQLPEASQNPMYSQGRSRGPVAAFASSGFDTASGLMQGYQVAPDFEMANNNNAFADGFAPNGQATQFDPQFQSSGMTHGTINAAMQSQYWQMHHDPDPDSLDPLPVHGIPDSMNFTHKDEGAFSHLAAPSSFSMQPYGGGLTMEPLRFDEISSNMGLGQHGASTDGLGFNEQPSLQLPHDQMHWQSGACTTNQMFGQGLPMQTFSTPGGALGSFDHSVLR